MGIMHFTQTLIRDKLYEREFNTMKKCSYCGAEYPDEATACAIDATPLDTPKDAPQNPAEAQSTSTPLKFQSIWIPYMIFCSIMSVVGIFSYISNWQRMDDLLPPGPLIILRCAAFLCPLSILAIWWNSRSGVVAFLALDFITLSVCLTLGITLALLGIIGVIIFILLVRPRWQQMTWDIKMPGNEKDDV
jgi:hypothetical protein